MKTKLFNLQKQITLSVKANRIIKSKSEEDYIDSLRVQRDSILEKMRKIKLCSDHPIYHQNQHLQNRNTKYIEIYRPGLGDMGKGMAVDL